VLLAIDVGNTNTVIGLFDGDVSVGSWRIRTMEDATADELLVVLRGLTGLVGIDRPDITAAIISCVVPPLQGALDELCRKHLNISPLFVGPGMKSGMPIRYDNPKEVGADRIVNAVAAYEKHKRSLIAVDFGTATTFDYVNDAGEYEGGVIAPGVKIAAEALFRQASKLFRVEFRAPAKVVAKDTASAIQSGVVFGYASLVDGILERMFKEIGKKPLVIATGGLARVIAPETKLVDHVDDDLTMEGLLLLYRRNNPPKQAAPGATKGKMSKAED
jgi:type III pantothenate kinase